MEQQINNMKTVLDAGAAISSRVMYEAGGKPFVIVPEGYAVHEVESMLPSPAGKRANVVLSDSGSFVIYALKHGNKGDTMIYAELESEESRLNLVGVLNDHATDKANWRNHTCTFKPEKSVEWKRWLLKDRAVMSQVDFAIWLEDNLQDIATVAGMPTGADILAMAVQFEANADRKLKSKLNLQNGAIQFEFSDEEDNGTRTKMEVFRRFTLGIPVFDGSGSAYPLEARLKYKESSGKVTFWYELIRADLVFKTAANEELNNIADKTGFVIVNGKP